MNAIQLTGVGKRYGATEALSGLTLDVGRGEMFGLIGPDGAGKTTAIRLMCGLLHADAGAVRVLGLDPAREHRRISERVGYLSQRFSLYGDLTIDENVAFFAEIHGVTRYHARRDQLLEMTQLTPFRGRRADRLSGGMKQKLALACTLVHEPELILLDEPTSGLDPIGTAEIKDLIRELRKQGKTIVLSGHLLADMQDICDRIAILHRGELKEIGQVSDLLTVQDVTQIKVRDLPESALREIRGVIEQNGAQLLSVEHPTTTLEELFLRIVHESELHPGRRRVAGDQRRALQPAATGNGAT
jgi:ABC-2 type transport system ATP-binding protein